MVLVQDSLGLRPLFYCTDGDRLTVASELEILVAFLERTELEEGYFAELLGRGCVPAQ